MLGFGIPALAQPLEPFLKALQKGDSAKAASLVQKAGTKTYSRDSLKEPALFYDKWLLQQAKWGTKAGRPVWDSQAEEKAIEAIDRALIFWPVLSPKQKAQYRKWRSDSTYLVERKGIVDQDYVGAMLGAKYIALHQVEYYLDQRPNTKFKQQLLEARDSLAFLDLRNSGFRGYLREYESYLTKYPSSKWTKSVQRLAQKSIAMDLLKAQYRGIIDEALGESAGSIEAKRIPKIIRDKLPESLLDSIRLRRIQLCYPFNYRNLVSLVYYTKEVRALIARNTFLAIWAYEAMANAQFGEGLMVPNENFGRNAILDHTNDEIYRTCLPIPTGQSKWQWQHVKGQYLPIFDSVPTQALKQKWPGLIAGYRSGKLHYRFTVGDTSLHAIDSLSYVGLGWYQLWKEGKAALRWVGNFYQIEGDITKAKLLSNQVVLVRYSNQTSRIFSVLGLELSDYLKIDDAEILNPEGKGDDEILVLANRSKFRPVILSDTYDPVLWWRSSEDAPNFIFDDVRLITNEIDRQSNFLVTKGEEQGVWGGDRYLIPLGRYRITQGNKGWFLTSNIEAEYRILWFENKRFVADKMLPTTLAIAFRKNGKWGLLSYEARVLQSPVYDTVQVLGSSVFLLTQGRSKVLSFGQDGLMDVSRFLKVEPLFPLKPLPKRNQHAPDPAPFLAKTDSTGTKRIYNIKNRLMWAEPVLSVDRPTDDLLIIRKQVIRYDTTFPTPAQNRKSKGKRKKPAMLPLITQSIAEKVGLVDTAGKVILPFVYDGITLSDLANQEGDLTLNLLANQRFGLASLWHRPTEQGRRVVEIKSLIEPTSDRSFRWLSFGGKQQFSGFGTERNGLLGVLNNVGQEIIPNEFEEIVSVSYDTWMVRRADSTFWNVYRFQSQDAISLNPLQPLRKIKSVAHLGLNEPEFAPYALSVATSEDSILVWVQFSGFDAYHYKLKATNYRLLKHGRLDYLVLWDGQVGQRKVYVMILDYLRLNQVPVPISEAMLNRLLQEED